MKRINNKGFAISSLLYGLTIMIFLIVFALMSTMGSTRKNTRNLVETIDDELNRYGLIDQKMEYNPDIDIEDTGRAYTVLEDGYYYIELYGASHPRSSGWYVSEEYKRGSYIAGTIYLKANTMLYFHLGNKEMLDERNDTYVTYEEDDDEYTIMKAPGAEGNGSKNPTFYQNTGVTVVHDRQYIAVGYAGSKEFEHNTTNPKAKINNKDLYFMDVKYLRYVNAGYGKAIIKKADAPQRENEALDNVRYIKDCIEKNNINNYVAWAEIQAIDENGKNVARSKIPTVDGSYTSTTGIIYAVTNGSTKINESNMLHYAINNPDPNQTICMKIDLGAPKKLNEVAVWHYHTDGRKYYNHSLSVSSNNTEWTNIKTSTHYTITQGNSTNEYDYSEIETSDGMHISAFQPQKISDGEYLIRKNYDYEKNKVLTYNPGSLSFETFNGSDNQKWDIKYTGDGSYGLKKITIRNQDYNCYLGVQNGKIICNKNKTDWYNDIVSNIIPYRIIYKDIAPPTAIDIEGNISSYSAAGSKSQYLFIKVNK